MNLGEKIRKNRLLHKLTQQELGEKVGFKKSTADVRINQYESNKITPKDTMRMAIAEALDIDSFALSDIDISSFEDLMHVFFELEDTLGMAIDKKDGRTWLSFDDNNPSIQTLITYLNLWYNKKKQLGLAQDDSYRLMKSRFITETQQYLHSKESEIENYYAEEVQAVRLAKGSIRNTTEIVNSLRVMIESGMSVQPTLSGNGFVFVINELLNPKNAASKNAFAEFLFAVEYLKSISKQLENEIFTDVQITGNTFTIAYYFPVEEVFSVIKLNVESIIKHFNSGTTDNDFAQDMLEYGLKKYNWDIVSGLETRGYIIDLPK